MRQPMVPKGILRLYNFKIVKRTNNKSNMLQKVLFLYQSFNIKIINTD